MSSAESIRNTLRNLSSLLSRTARALACAAVVIVTVPAAPPALASGPSTISAPLNLSQSPLFVASGVKPNVLLNLANSQSMDEDATGLAVGGANRTSRSEIVRRVARGLIASYHSSVNMGLMAFEQRAGDLGLWDLHSSPYDVSYNPGDWNPAFTGARDSQTKRFRAPNVSDPGSYIYYNVNLPFYNPGNAGNLFCWSGTAHAFNNGEVLWSGPWDTYWCYNSKTGPSNNVPTDPSAGGADGWSGLAFGGEFWPTDSDLGQGITDFGTFIAWNWVSPTWFTNGSPGRGYIHVPVAALTATQIAKMNTKLGTSQFVVNGPNNPALPLQNAGLTPLEGSLFTARDYFAGTLADAAQGGPLPAPPNSCGKNFVILLTNGLPSVDKDGNPSSDVVAMLAATTAAAAALSGNDVVTYVVGFALPFGVNPAQLDTIAAAGGSGTAYNANNEVELKAALDAVLADIITRSGAASSVALSTGSVSSSSKLFQAKFDAGWVGQLLAYSIDQATGEVAASPDWSASAVLNSMSYDTDRQILTYRRVSGRGVPFRWPSPADGTNPSGIDSAQIAALNADITGTADGRGAARVNYLRGDHSLEGPDLATQFRVRSSAMGDIVNSAPVYVGPPPRNIRDSDYYTFRSAAGVAGREPIVYVGGNDGMLHAFRATDGRELLAYVPAGVYDNLTQLTSQAYSHHYFVDETPDVEDAKIGAAAPYWRTMLASGLGAGGRSIFALDVTDPSAFSEINASSIAMWEFDSNQDADLGYTYGQPAIVKMNDGSWAVIVGNGLNNTGSGQSGIFILNAQTGAVIRKIMTGVGSVGAPNGISGFTPVDLDGNGTTDYVYAGDIYGNMWKFDLTSNNSASWTIAFGGNPLYQAVRGGNSQPITVAPEVTRHPLHGLLIEFGTGMYLQTSDISSTALQSVYGIWDNGNPVNNLSDLQQQSVTGTVTFLGQQYRTVTSNAVNWSSKDGWYLDLPTAGERVAVGLLIHNGRLLVTSLIPNSNVCTAGGNSWLMELDFASGGQSPSSIFDSNHDGTVDTHDTVAAGIRMSGISSSPSILGGFGPPGSENSLEHSYSNESTSDISDVLQRANPLNSRRMSWRQIR